MSDRKLALDGMGLGHKIDYRWPVKPLIALSNTWDQLPLSGGTGLLKEGGMFRGPCRLTTHQKGRRV